MLKCLKDRMDVNLCKFNKTYPYRIAVDISIPYYYYEAIIRNMNIEYGEWNSTIEGYYSPIDIKPKEILWYGFKKESDLLYFKLAVVNNEKGK